MSATACILLAVTSSLYAVHEGAASSTSRSVEEQFRSLNVSAVSCTFVGLLCELSARGHCYGRCDLAEGGAIFLTDPEQASAFTAGDDLQLIVQPAGLLPGHTPPSQLSGVTIRRVLHRRLGRGSRRRLSTVGNLFGERGVFTVCMLYTNSTQQYNRLQRH